MRNVILAALALVVVAWYARHRKRLMRARKYAHEATERWESEEEEGGSIPRRAAPLRRP